jgi:hypothetical protein
MKTAAVCVVCALGAFAVMHFHLSGQFGDGEAEAPAVKEEPPAEFPQDLVPAARGESVPRAAAFNPKSEVHPTVVLQRNGKLHDWHLRLPADWLADSVETTELVMVAGPPQRTLLQTVYYPNGAPPVRRYRYDVKVWLLEARTGGQIATHCFRTDARPIRPVELWDLTELGQPVECVVVIDWMKAKASAYADALLAGR